MRERPRDPAPRVALRRRGPRRDRAQPGDGGHPDREECDRHCRERELWPRRAVRVRRQREQDQQHERAAGETDRPAARRQSLDAAGMRSEALEVGVVERHGHRVARVGDDEDRGGEYDLPGRRQREQRGRRAAEQRERDEEPRVRLAAVGPRAHERRDDARDDQRHRGRDAPQGLRIGSAGRDVGREVKREQDRRHDRRVGGTPDVVEHPRPGGPAMDARRGAGRRFQRVVGAKGAEAGA